MIKETTFEFMFLASLTTMTLNIFLVFERDLQNKILHVSCFDGRLSAILSLNPVETGTCAASSAVFNNPSFLRTTQSSKKMLSIYYNHDFFSKKKKSLKSNNIAYEMCFREHMGGGLAYTTMGIHDQRFKLCQVPFMLHPLSSKIFSPSLHFRVCNLHTKNTVKVSHQSAK